jgi:hypothetical protein
MPTENYPRIYHTGKACQACWSFFNRLLLATDEFRKPLKKPPLEQRVHYITPEPYSHSFTENYVNDALKSNGNLKSKSPVSSFLDYSTVTQHEAKTIPKVQRQKVYSSENEDYNYYFPESKRIATKSTKKPLVKDHSEKFYKPQAPGAVISKDLKTNGDENVNTYHYYYPEVPSYDDKSHQSFPSSTITPTTTKFPKIKFPPKKKLQPTQFEQTSTDSYQYQPVLQRPNEFFPSDQDFYPSFDSKSYAGHSTPTPSTVSPIKMLRPTKKNNYYLPTGSTTAKPMKIRRPSTDSPYKDVKQFSVSPSPSTVAHYSTTRAPEVFKYSTTRTPEVFKYPTPSPVSSTTFSDFYIKPSTQVTPTASVELQHDGSQRTVVIQPKKPYKKIEDYEFKPEKPMSYQGYDGFESKKTDNFINYEAKKVENFDSFLPKKIESYENFQPKATVKQTNLDAYDNFDLKKDVMSNFENYQPKETVKETIVYKFVPEETYGSKEIYDFPKENFNQTFFYSTAASYPEFQDVANESNSQFANDFHKNYNYEFFTEQDAGKMPSGDAFNSPDIDETHEVVIDDKQRASKKNMFYEFTPHISDEYSHSSMSPENLDEREIPPPMHEITGDRDNNAEASKNQYFVLYSIDDEEKEKKHKKYPKRKPKPEPEVVYHHHHHQHDEKPEDFHSFDQEFDSEFDSELTNSDNVRIVDPNVRGGRPIEFTKDDYLRHIKQAVVQYMKDYTPSNSQKVKNQRLQEAEVPYRPTKAPVTATTPTSYRQSLSPQQYKTMAPMKLPKNVYTAGKLKDALDELHESPQVDLTVKKHKQKPFDLSAIDVGQTYQHVSHFDHSAALKNVEDFDQTNVVPNQPIKTKLHFSQQTYHDINNLGFNSKPKQPQHAVEESEGEQQGEKLFKGYHLPKKYKGNQADGSFSSMNFDGSKLPKIISQRGQDDDDEDENKIEEPVDAPIQIINGIPVANPYNIDLNTLK